MDGRALAEQKKRDFIVLRELCFVCKRFYKSGTSWRMDLFYGVLIYHVLSVRCLLAWSQETVLKSDPQTNNVTLYMVYGFVYNIIIKLVLALPSSKKQL